MKGYPRLGRPPGRVFYQCICIYLPPSGLKFSSTPAVFTLIPFASEELTALASADAHPCSLPLMKSICCQNTRSPFHEELLDIRLLFNVRCRIYSSDTDNTMSLAVGEERM